MRVGARAPNENQSHYRPPHAARTLFCQGVLTL